MKSAFPFLPILALIFITLKLTNVITWSWLAVLAPIWVPFAIALTLITTVGILSVFLSPKKRRF